jgi:hypothetical protein
VNGVVAVAPSDAARPILGRVPKTGRRQLELGSVATPYQRVTTAFDVTEAGVRDCYYLQGNGVNTALVTGTITPGTDKVQVVAGVEIEQLCDNGTCRKQ